MASPRLAALGAASSLFFVMLLRAEQAQSADPFTGTVNANGMLLAENSSAIERSRLRRDEAHAPGTVDANGNTLPETESSASDDDSFGAQQILKEQERPRPFTLSGGASILYTNNAALTRDHTEDDVFAVVAAGIGWSSRLRQNLEANLGLHAEMFRYNKMSRLDFNSLGFGAGLAWNPDSLRGVTVFGQYDFTELLTRGGDEILRDHTLALGLQKLVPFGRSHALTIGATGLLDLSDPNAARRSQLGVFFNYHLQISRKLESDFLLRPAVHYYTETDRVDWNNLVSANLRYRFSKRADLSAFFSYGFDRSNRARFDYEVATTGAGIDFDFRF